MDKPIHTLWKFQWPVTGKEALIYDEDQTVNILLPCTAELRALFEGHFKFYAWANWDPDTNSFSFDRERPFIFNLEDPEYPEW